MAALKYSDLSPLALRLGRQGQRSRSCGFTLMELMIVVVIIGVLLRIALPAYSQYTQKARRTIAKTALLDLAARQEKFYSLQNIYSDVTNSGTNLGYTADLPRNLKDDSGAVIYSLTITTFTAASGSTPAFYIATASIPAGSPQVGDACGSFTLNSRGVQGASLTTCW